MQPEKKLFKYPYEYKLELGRTLPGFELCYTTYGTLNETGDNVVWVCHALTGNSDPSDWWSGLVGKDKLYNPAEHFIVCANIPGSCYGSTNPLSVNPRTQQSWYHDFPTLTVKDVVGTLDLLRQELGIETIQVCIGGSLGGQQALEWAVENPRVIKRLITIATNALHSPWGIAFNEAQRMAIAADESWKENRQDAGLEGLKAARSVALLSYRNYDTYNFTQARDNSEQLDDFRAASYQQYQGEKFKSRFNAFSYWILTKMMDSHNVGRNRGGLANALKQVTALTLVIGIKSDILFPIEEQHFLEKHIPRASYQEIDSLYGHDGFLIDYGPLTHLIRAWLKNEGHTDEPGF